MAVPNIFLNKMYVRRMHRVRNSTQNNTQNNELEMKFYTVGTMKFCNPHPSKGVTFFGSIYVTFFGVYITFFLGRILSFIEKNDFSKNNLVIH